MKDVGTHFHIAFICWKAGGRKQMKWLNILVLIILGSFIKKGLEQHPLADSSSKGTLGDDDAGEGDGVEDNTSSGGGHKASCGEGKCGPGGEEEGR